MKQYAKSNQFEKAVLVRKTVFALQHIQDVALIRRDKKLHSKFSRVRMEAYDVAHMSGNNTVGVMTVIENGQSTAK